MELKGRAGEHFKNIFAISLGVFSLILSLSNSIVGFNTGFGMIVDISTVPIFFALFYLSYKHAIKSLVVFSFLLLFFSESGFIGALMKFTATLPLLALPYFATNMGFGKVGGALLLIVILLLSFALLSNVYVINEFLSSILLFILSIMIVPMIKEESYSSSFFKILPLSIILRGVVMIVANIYFAGPLFFKMSSEELFSFFDNLEFPFLGRIGIYGIIFLWNAIQSILEVSVAYLLYKAFLKVKNSSLKGG